MDKKKKVKNSATAKAAPANKSSKVTAPAADTKKTAKSTASAAKSAKKLTEPASKAAPAGKTAKKAAPKSQAVAQADASLTPDYLVLMQKDPNWMQAFWDVNEARMQEAQQAGNKLVLRMYDVSKDLTIRNQKKLSFYDIVVPWDARSWYVQNTYQEAVAVALGYSSNSDEPESFQEIMSSAEVYTITPNGQSWTTGGTADRFVAASLGVHGIGGSSEQGLSSWSIADVSSSLSPSSEALSSWSTPVSAPYTAPGMHWRGQGKDFFLWVKTRLIVYGGTRPDANLQVRGEPFPLNPDGTFSLEMDLPDSTQVIPVFATDKDGDFPTTIVPVVVKRTE